MAVLALPSLGQIYRCVTCLTTGGSCSLGEFLALECVKTDTSQGSSPVMGLEGRTPDLLQLPQSSEPALNWPLPKAGPSAQLLPALVPAVVGRSKAQLKAQYVCGPSLCCVLTVPLQAPTCSDNLCQSSLWPCSWQSEL